MLVSTVAFIHGQHGDNMPQVRDDPNAFFVTAELGVRCLFLSLGTFAMY